MNLFPEQPKINHEALYYKNLEAEKMKQFNEFIEIKMEVRKLISSYSGLRLKLAKELLEVERSSDQKYREEYYKNFTKRYDELEKLGLNP